MAFHPVTPDGGFGGLAEDAEEVAIRISAYSVIFFHDAKDVFQAHDGGGLDEALLAESGAQQARGQTFLRGGHVFQRQTFAGFRNEMPVQTLVIFKLEGGLRFLSGVSEARNRLAVSTIILAE